MYLIQVTQFTLHRPIYKFSSTIGNYNHLKKEMHFWFHASAKGSVMFGVIQINICKVELVEAISGFYAKKGSI